MTARRQKPHVSPLQFARTRWQSAALLALGLVAGGATAHLTRGIVPPVLVLGLATVALLYHERRGPVSPGE